MGLQGYQPLNVYMKDCFDLRSQPNNQEHNDNDKYQDGEHITQKRGENYAQSHTLPIPFQHGSDVSHRLKKASRSSSKRRRNSE